MKCYHLNLTISFDVTDHGMSMTRCLKIILVTMVNKNIKPATCIKATYIAASNIVDRNIK